MFFDGVRKPVNPGSAAPELKMPTVRVTRATSENTRVTR
jgi:hypothetical protein